MPLSEEAKERLILVLAALRTTIHFGYMPLIFYLGHRAGSSPGYPPFSFWNVLPNPFDYY
ncbi:mitochondrial import receptor subunit TOM7 homolog [Teleopsis dalmanni]|uniref:mitochondrial import receptor subunit TOM7 homolog n=1 Tax=Teleopsis dalmanni TaxID=139649 RepID=UPI0018CFCAB6|nr:mitochondrial import receptor subunit TOM7 homolog [Teleopsis dalmanni]